MKNYIKLTLTNEIQTETTLYVYCCIEHGQRRTYIFGTLKLELLLGPFANKATIGKYPTRSKGPKANQILQNKY
jgi:hypothetical protein